MNKYENKKTENDDSRYTKEERGLQPAKNPPPMPKVKPPKED
ncbi:hypothetical protein [Serratia sp. FGI94]|nr:hypothetical protein [Serratia sp. FGI94]